MGRGCTQDGCTVAETGSCALGFDPETCENRVRDDASIQDTAKSNDEGDSDEDEAIAAGLADIAPPQKYPSFPASFSLGPEDVNRLMSRRYCHLVGIVGAPDAGKTAALVSLYLLLAKAELASHRYANSETLRGFDEISRGSRRWNQGQLPDQLTKRTESSDDRQAGYLHLRLRDADGKFVDLLLPDLPGEWSRALVDNNRWERLAFLQRADTIWLTVDGQQLADTKTRHLAIHRTKLLMQRLTGFLDPMPPVILVVTRIDKGDVPEAALASLQSEAEALDIVFSVQRVACFADPTAMKPGTGIADLLIASLSENTAMPALWPPDREISNRARAILRFGVE